MLSTGLRGADRFHCPYTIDQSQVPSITRGIDKAHQGIMHGIRDTVLFDIGVKEGISGIEAWVAAAVG